VRCDKATFENNKSKISPCHSALPLCGIHPSSNISWCTTQSQSTRISKPVDYGSASIISATPYSIWYTVSTISTVLFLRSNAEAVNNPVVESCLEELEKSIINSPALLYACYQHQQVQLLLNGFSQTLDISIVSSAIALGAKQPPSLCSATACFVVTTNLRRTLTMTIMFLFLRHLAWTMKQTKLCTYYQRMSLLRQTVMTDQTEWP